MKIENEEVFAKYVGKKIEKAKELGMLASWTTRDHLIALAEAVEKSTNVLETLEDCYNISGYQQHLAKVFLKTGHFQREQRGTTNAETLLEKLAKEVQAKEV